MYHASFHCFYFNQLMHNYTPRHYPCIQGYYKRNSHFHNLRSSLEERWKFVSRHSFVWSAPRQRPRHHWSKIFPLRYYANCVSSTLTVSMLRNVESVYFQAFSRDVSTRQHPWYHRSKFFPIRYYANCASTTLTVLISHNVDSVYYFCSKPV
jgi:hypothetical protein